MSRFLDRINIHQLGKILTIAVYPAGILGMSVLAFDAGPFHIFPYRVLIPIIWLLVILRLISRGGRLSLAPVKVKLYGLFLLIWLIYAAVSTIWAINTGAAIKHTIFLLLSFSVISFSVIFLDRVEDLYLVSVLWMVVLGLAVLWGVSETITGYHLPVSRFHQTQSAFYLYTPTGVFYNPNDFATFLALSAPLPLSFFLFSKKILYRAVSLLTFFGLLYALVATRSRANMLAALLVIVFFIIVMITSRKRKYELWLMLGGSLLLVFVFREKILDEFGVLIAAFQTLPDQIANPTKSIGIRVNLIRNGFYFLKSTWGFGVGAGNFESWMRARAIFRTGHIISAHSWFLEVLVNYGALIFLGYLVFYLGLIYQAFRVFISRQDDQRMKTLGAALLGGMIAFFLASISSSSIIAFRPQWLLFALGLAYINVGLSSSQGQA